MIETKIEIWLVALIILVICLFLVSLLFLKFSLFLIQENRKSERLIEVLRSKLKHSKQKEEQKP